MTYVGLLAGSGSPEARAALCTQPPSHKLMSNLLGSESMEKALKRVWPGSHSRDTDWQGLEPSCSNLEEPVGLVGWGGLPVEMLRQMSGEEDKCDPGC